MKQLLSVLILIASFQVSAQVYREKEVYINFFSDGILEDITATSNSAVGALDTSKNTFACIVFINSFQFENALMQEHFNENYMESDKYPKAKFTANILDSINYSVDSVYQVKTIGKITIHGVTQEREIIGTITVKNGEIRVQAKFDVQLKDHNIDIPKVVISNIAEVVAVEVNILLGPKSK